MTGCTGLHDRRLLDMKKRWVIHRWIHAAWPGSGSSSRSAARGGRSRVQTPACSLVRRSQTAPDTLTRSHFLGGLSGMKKKPLKINVKYSVLMVSEQGFSPSTEGSRRSSLSLQAGSRRPAVSQSPPRRAHRAQGTGHSAQGTAHRAAL